MNPELVRHALIIFLLTFLGGALVLIRRWSDDTLHFLLSFGAGIFLGIVFVHLLPESIHRQTGPMAGVFILVGFLFLFFVEKFLLSRGNDSYRREHEVIGITAFVGLSVHSITDGLGLAVTLHDPELGPLFFVSILAHKIPAAIALVSLLILAGTIRKHIVIFLGVFSAMTPVGALLFGLTLRAEGHSFLTMLTALVTGSFLYIATAELLPEVFHGHRRRWLNLLLLILGIGVAGWLGMMISHLAGSPGGLS